MVHANNYYNVPCDLWDDIKKDKRYFVVNKKINCYDKCMDKLYLDLREYNELTDKYCIKIKEIVKNKTGRDMYHNSYEIPARLFYLPLKEMALCWNMHLRS